MKQALLFITIFVSFQVQAQEEKEVNSFGVSDEVKIDGAPSIYSSYFSEYYINENWNFRAEMQQLNIINSFENQSIIDFPLLAKYKFSEKWSALFGPNIRLFKGLGNIENVELLSTFRTQYNINKTFSLEAGINLNLTTSNFQHKKNMSDGMKYKLGGRFKF